MIIFEKIRWKNLLSYGNVWTEVDLKRSPNTLIVGENGSGKSTALRILSTLLEPDSGTVILEGENVLTNTRNIFSQK